MHTSIVSPNPQARFCWPLLLTVGFWGYNFIAIKVVYGSMTPEALSLVRWFVMLLGMILVCLIMKVPIMVNREDRWRTFLQGFLSMGVYMILFLEGMKYTRPAEAAIILATAPIFTASVAWLSKQEMLGKKFLLWALAAFLGVSLVVLGNVHQASANSQDASNRVLGDALILISSVVWAFATVLSRPVATKYSPITFLTASMIGSLPALLIYGFHDTFVTTEYSKISPLTWGYVFYIAMGAGVIAFTCFYYGVKQIGAAGTMVYQYLVSPLATLLSWIVLGQTLTWIQYLGFAIVLCSVVMANQARYHSSQAT